MLTETEEQRFRLAARTLQEKAFASALLELGVTPEEFLSLSRNSVIFDEHGVVVYIKSKKHLPRAIPIVDSEGDLANWIENHPLKDPDAPLWISESTNSTYDNSSRLKYEGYDRRIKKLAFRAHIEKRVYGYLLRHGRLTKLVKKNILHGEKLRKYGGWVN